MDPYDFDQAIQPGAKDFDFNLQQSRSRLIGKKLSIFPTPIIPPRWRFWFATYC